MKTRKCGWDIGDGIICEKVKAKTSNWCAQHLQELVELENKPQHTPTPWKTDGKHIDTDDEKGFQIAVVLSGPDSRNADEQYVSKEEAKANAKLIVRAVNSHEELVEDLAICLQSFGKDMQNDFRRRIERHLKEALAKAEGKI